MGGILAFCLGDRCNGRLELLGDSPIAHFLPLPVFCLISAELPRNDALLKENIPTMMGKARKSTIAAQKVDKNVSAASSKSTSKSTSKSKPKGKTEVISSDEEQGQQDSQTKGSHPRPRPFIVFQPTVIAKPSKKQSISTRSTKSVSQTQKLHSSASMTPEQPPRSKHMRASSTHKQQQQQKDIESDEELKDNRKKKQRRAGYDKKLKATPQRQQSQCIYDVISCDENTVNENKDGRTASGASEDDREGDENEGEDSEVYSEDKGDFEEAEDILEGEKNDQEGGENDQKGGENDQEGGENDFERDDEEMYISR